MLDRSRRPPLIIGSCLGVYGAIWSCKSCVCPVDRAKHRSHSPGLRLPSYGPSQAISHGGPQQQWVKRAPRLCTHACLGRAHKYGLRLHEAQTWSTAVRPNSFLRCLLADFVPVDWIEMFFLNNLRLDLVFDFHLILKAFKGSCSQVLGQTPVAHGWVNMKVEQGHLILSPSCTVFILTWDLLEEASCDNKNFTMQYCLSFSWVSRLMPDLLSPGALSRIRLLSVTGTLPHIRLPVKR